MRPDNGPQRGDSSPPMAHAEPGPELARSDHPAVRHDQNENSPHAAVSTYDRYIAGLTGAGQIPFLNRYSAIPDAQLDSLENPAYAAGFRTAKGRVFLMPTFGGQTGLEKNAAALGPAGSLPADYSISPQFSVFAPLPGGHFVLGGAAVASRLDATSTFLTGSLLAAVRLGAVGQNSFGLKIDRVRGSGVLSAATPDSSVFHTKWTAGFARESSQTQTLGVSVSYSLVSGTENGLDASGHTLEAGFRLRGAVTPRLLYGISGSWVGLSLRDTGLGAGEAASGQHVGAQRGSLAMGLGYILNRRTVLSLDVAGAVSGNRAARLQATTGSPLESASASERFLSLHGAVQADITRRLFGTASLLVLAQSRRFGSALFPHPFGNLTPAPDLSFALAATAYPMATHFSDFGIGWRFSSGLFAEYVYSTSYGYSAASHALMLRYTIRFHRQ